MLLDTATRSLQIGLLEGITTSNLHYDVEYEEVRYPEAKVMVTNLGDLTGTPYIKAVAEPGNNIYRHIEEINIYNGDTVTHNVFIAIVDGVSVYVVFKGTLTASQTLHYNEYFGWTIN